MPISAPPSPAEMLFGANIRRLMARFDMTFADVVEATGLDERTLRSLLRDQTRPHARTIHKLATGLGISTDELFREPSRAAEQAAFDRATNPTAAATIEKHPEMFAGWTAEQFDELYSHRGVGGELTEEGTLALAESMNQRRELLNQAALLLETDQADLLRDFIGMLYERASAVDGTTPQVRKTG
ncbi:MAG: helix-turn-helix transcriptional regulator [Lacipirellulaceae bacterium]